MKLSKYFSLSELTKSMTAIRYGVKNTPTPTHTENLKRLCTKVLDPIREKFGAFSPTSGYRSLQLNRFVGGSLTSQHMSGEAADIDSVGGVSNYDLAVWIRDNLVFDQLILEFYKTGQPNSGWVHVSYREGANRKQVMTTADGKKFTVGLHK